MIEALYIFYINGRLLIQRSYRTISNKKNINNYINKYIKTRKIFECPVIEINNEYFINVTVNEIIITVVIRKNCNICLIFNFLYKFIEILNHFFNNDLSGLNIINNFVLIYEICDEILDYGYPQLLEINILENSLINKVKYYSKSFKYFEDLSKEPEKANNIIEDVINDSSSQNYQLYLAYKNDSNNKKNNLKKKNTYELSNERKKIKNLNKKAFKKIKNKIINQCIQQANFITGKCTWRNNNIYYKKNEIYMEILEILNVTIHNNQFIHAHINGKIKLKCLLSGMPICELSTNNGGSFSKNKNECNDLYDSNDVFKNDKMNKKINKKINNISNDIDDEIIIDNCIFHHCVTLSKLENNKRITFIPPDGSFELMKYTITKKINIPFDIIALYNPVTNYIKLNSKNEFLKKLKGNNQNNDENKYEYCVAIKSNFKGNIYADDVVIIIPIYKFTDNVEIFYKSIGKTEYNKIENIVIWRIKKFSSSTQHEIKIHLTIEKHDNIYSGLNIQTVDNFSKVVLQLNKNKNVNILNFLNKYKIPIILKFQIPTFTSSGLYIKYLKIFEKSDYEVVKWIKYVTKSGIYQYI